MNTDKIIHMLRNLHGFSYEAVRQARLEAADEIVKLQKLVPTPEPAPEWEPAYFNSVLSDFERRIGPAKSFYREALEALISYTRQRAYKAEFDPDFVPDWNDRSQNKYFPYFDYDRKKWFVAEDRYCEQPNTIYYSKDVCDELCKRLESGWVRF